MPFGTREIRVLDAKGLAAGKAARGNADEVVDLPVQYDGLDLLQQLSAFA